MSNESTDKELVKRVQRGDKGAFDLLVLKYQHKILSLVARYVRNRAEVEDVTQEAFIKAYKALSLFRGDSAFYTWLYRIAINTAKNWLVARNRRPPPGPDAVSRPGPRAHCPRTPRECRQRARVCPGRAGAPDRSPETTQGHLR